VDAGVDCRAVTFRPKHFDVDFGVFTCADIIHSWPVLDMVSKGIRHFVMPLAWTNEMSQMQPLGWMQSWSRIMNVTLLSANCRDEGKETGSGIFSRGDAIAKAYSLSGEPDQLLVAPLPKLPHEELPPKPCPAPGGSESVSDDPWLTVQLDMSPGAHTTRACSKFHEAAMNPLCCELAYEAKSEHGYGYVLAILNGKDEAEGITPWVAQTCAVLPCQEQREVDDGYMYTHQEFLDWYGDEGEEEWASAERRLAEDGNAYSHAEFLDFFGASEGQQRWDIALRLGAGEECMTYPTETMAQEGATAFGEFISLDLQGNFSSEVTIFPIVLAGRDRLQSSEILQITSAGRRAVFSGSDAKELIQLQLYGRLYSRDKGYSKCPCSGGTAPE